MSSKCWEGCEGPKDETVSNSASYVDVWDTIHLDTRVFRNNFVYARIDQQLAY